MKSPNQRVFSSTPSKVTLAAGIKPVTPMTSGRITPKKTVPKLYNPTRSGTA